MLPNVCDHVVSRARSRSTREAQLFAFDSCSRTRRIVGVYSTARRKRNHTGRETERTTCVGVSLRSSAIKPKPPPWISRSVARRAWSAFRQRTQTSCRSLTPAISAEWGSNASRASTSAQTSDAAVREASAEISKLVLPEHGGPQISVKLPRGSPPVRSSIGGMPVGTVSTIRRSRYWKGFERRFASADSTCKRNEAAFELIVKGEDAKKRGFHFRFLFAYR